METQEAEVLNMWLQQTVTATQAAQGEALLPKRGGASVIWSQFGFKQSSK